MNVVEKNKRKCSIDYCSRFFHAKDLCEPHYRQQLEGREISSILKKRDKGTSLIRNEFGEKLCLGCNRWLNENLYTLDPSTQDRLKVRCKLCKLLQLNNYDYDNYLILFNKQNGACAVCSDAPMEKSLALDHDHKCCPKRYSCGNCIRGLLCSACNFAEGLLKSDLKIISNLLQYVKNGGTK
jgi:hypothetical protein